MSNSKLDLLKRKLITQLPFYTGENGTRFYLAGESFAINSANLVVMGGLHPDVEPPYNLSCNGWTSPNNSSCTNYQCSTSGQVNSSCTNPGCSN